MTRLIWLLLGVFILGSCGQGGYGSGAVSEIGLQNIKLCYEQYERLSGKEIFREAEKAYVHVSGSRFGVLFVRGEVGTFGPPSDDYQAFLSCSVFASDDKAEIYYLGEPLKDPLIGDLENAFRVDEGFYDGHVVELLYVREGDKFLFKKSQKFVEPKPPSTLSDEILIE